MNYSLYNTGENHGSTAPILRTAANLLTEADRQEFLAEVAFKLFQKESDLSQAWKIFNRSNSQREANRIRQIEIHIGTLNRAKKLAASLIIKN